MRKLGLQRWRMRTSAGVSIVYWQGPPRRLGIRERFHVLRHGNHGAIHLAANIPAHADHAPLLPARGSVVLLHPWGGDSSSMMLWAIPLLEAGYGVVVPDLRDQGASGTAPVGYGPREAGDIAQLVGRLRRQGRLPGPLFLLGASYGASVALFAEPRPGML